MCFPITAPDNRTALLQPERLACIEADRRDSALRLWSYAGNSSRSFSVDSEAKSFNHVGVAGRQQTGFEIVSVVTIDY
jgi:hypothetical protein